MTYPFETMIAELQRELAMRHAVYPKWVRNKQLTPEQALQRIEVMQQVLAFIEHHRDEDKAAQLARDGKL